MTPAEIRETQLQIMDVVDAFCTENGLRYSLSSGTLLGAIRHKGFIPWDDDVDILMPRPDYERFWRAFNAASDGRYTAYNYMMDDEFPHVICRVSDNTTLALNHNRVNKYGVFVDVYVVDAQPDDPEAFERYVETYLRLKTHLKKGAPIWRCTDSLLVKVKSLLRHPFYMSRKKTVAQLEAFFHAIPYGSTHYAGHITGGSGKRSRLDASLFKGTVRLPFEDRKYLCLAQYDAILRHWYGDYMQLPPEKDRKPYHSVGCYRLVR